MKKVLVGTLLGLWQLQAQAGLFDDDEARRQIATLQEQSNTRLQQLEMANRKMLDLANQVEQMQSEIAALKGKVDELNYGLQITQKRQQDLYVDLDSRIKPIEDIKSQAQTQAATKLLHTVTANIRAGKYKEAMWSLQKFIATYPHSEQMGAAYYWLGMSQAGLKHFTEARTSLAKVAADFPTDSHAPDALLALASVEASQGNKVAAVQTLSTLVERYNDSTAAQQAKKALASKMYR
jgi:tol-pal system protein YbgF